MKTIVQNLTNAWLVSLLLLAPGIPSQATGPKPGDSVTKEGSFDISLYMGPQWKMNLMLAIRRPGRVSITLKNASNTVLYREFLKRGLTKYWRKFNFEESEPGVYRFEISDGRKIIVRQVEIVAIPTVDAQRYIVYGAQTSQ